jgi:peptidoglycan/xylan/chitin deacetylase (PgdA/CDA1 family)
VPTSRPRRLPIVFCIDVEPEARAIETETPLDWDGFEQVHRILADLRPRLAAATGRPVHFSWFLRMDPQVAWVYGSAGWVADRYREALRELANAGDELGLHCHSWRRDDGGRRWVADYADQSWVDHCVESSFRAFAESLGRPCLSFRFGDHWMNDATLALVERLGARFDLTVEPGQGECPCAEPFVGRLTDFTDAPRRPYRPSGRDFRKPGRWSRRALWELPLTTGTAAGAFEALRERAAAVRAAGAGDGALEGWHDRTDDDVIAGWAFDARAPERVVAVDLYDGDDCFARVDAGSFRADLLAAGKGDGRHAFELPLPERLRDGNAHRIAVRIAGTDVSLGGTPQELRSEPRNGADSACLTCFVAFNPPLFRGMIESALDRQRLPYLATILRTSVLPADERARVERNLEYLLTRADVGRMVIATPAEAIALLRRRRPTTRISYGRKNDPGSVTSVMKDH